METLVDVDAPHTVFARDLNQAVQQYCLTITDAAELARQVADEGGIEPSGLVVHMVEDHTADCSRVHVTVGGRVEVTLRGPP
jgi:hypothetical protein